MPAVSGQTRDMADLETTPIDADTEAALTLFNEYVDADRERTRREKQVNKAERAKDEAATRVRQANDGGSAEERAAAETAYREAQEALKAIREGRDPEPAAAVEATDEAPGEATDEAPGEATDEAPGEATDEATPAAENAPTDEEE